MLTKWTCIPIMHIASHLPKKVLACHEVCSKTQRQPNFQCYKYYTYKAPDVWEEGHQCGCSVEDGK